MLVIEKKCKVCQTVKANKQLLKRIYESSYFVPHSKDTLFQISEATGIHYRGLLNHVKKHQFIDSQDYQEAMLQKADKDAEKKAVTKAVRGHSAVQTIIDRGAERLANKEIDVNTDQLLRASQLQMQADEKKKDQDLMAASLAFFMSGESQTNERLYVDAEPTNDTPELTANN
jgi:NurA-like 5'-3' nuclease